MIRRRYQGKHTTRVPIQVTVPSGGVLFLPGDTPADDVDLIRRGCTSAFLVNGYSLVDDGR